MESERQINLMHIAQNNRERARFGDKDYTEKDNENNIKGIRKVLKK